MNTYLRRVAEIGDARLRPAGNGAEESMSNRLRILVAVLLVLVGTACIVYAVASWYHMERLNAPANHVQPRIEHPSTNAEEAPGSDTSALPDDSRGKARAPGRRGHAIDETRRLWLVVGLPIALMALMVIILIPRWLKPRPMRRSGPSDSSDPWREAGKRLKL